MCVPNYGFPAHFPKKKNNFRPIKNRFAIWIWSFYFTPFNKHNANMEIIRRF